MRNRDSTKSSFKSLVTDIRGTLLEELEQAATQRYSLNARDRGKVRLSYQEQMDYTRLDSWLNDPARIHSDPRQNLKELIKERAYTLTNRLVILMQLECRGIRKVRLISRGLDQSAFRKEQEFFIALTQGDDLGFRFILQQVWDQLALELPALFEYNEIHECIPLPGPVLLSLIEKLNDEKVADAWTDDTTLGWLYQYWNEPDKAFIEQKLAGKGVPKGNVEAHEIGKKTQLFTDHYMVVWLLNNSIGDQWRAICLKNGWIEEEALVKDWKGYVWRELEPTYVSSSVLFLEDVKILDPAMGSGHFLVYAFELLYQLYQIQYKKLGFPFEADKIVNTILSQNLYGIDIDSRAVQISAAALYIKAIEKGPNADLKSLHIVATDLGLENLSLEDDSIIEFRKKLNDEIGIENTVINSLIDNLRHANSLGSLLQISQDIDEALAGQQYHNLAFDSEEALTFLTKEQKEDAIYQAVEFFIHNHDTGEDLGLKGLAAQLEKGLRLIHILRQKYDIVCANPPYLSTSSTNEEIAERLQRYSEVAKGDLYSLFFICFENLVKENGLWCVVAQHNWMFLGSLEDFRIHILRENAILKCSHLGTGAFEAISGEVVGSSMFVAQKTTLADSIGVYHRHANIKDYKKKQESVSYPDSSKVYSFPQSRFAEIPGSPMIYWWPEEFRQAYLKAPKLGEVSEVKTGMNSSNNTRFLRYFWEKNFMNVCNIPSTDLVMNRFKKWIPYIKGASGNRWFQSINSVIEWQEDGKNVKVFNFGAPGGRVQNKEYFFQQGLAFSYIGTNGFLCRLRKYKSIFDVSGSSIFCENPEKMQVILSSGLSGYVSQSINPTVNNQVGDIEKIPVLDQLKDYTLYLKRAYELYDELFSSTESNLEYSYRHLSSEKFEIEEARIRDDIDKELMAQFSQETREAIYKEIGESVFDYPQWDGSDAAIPDDFAQQYQQESSLLALSHHYKLHPDSLLQIKEKLGLIHEGQRKEKAFKDLSWAMGVLLGRFDAQTGGLVEMAEERRQEQGLTADPSAPRAHSHGLLYLSALDEWDNLDRPSDINKGQDCLSTLKAILTYKWGGEKARELWDEIEAALVLDCRTDWTPAQRGKKNLNDWIRASAFGMHESVYQKRPIYFPLVSAKKNFFLWVNIHKWNDGTLNALLANYLNPDMNMMEARIRRLREDVQKSGEASHVNALEKEITQLVQLQEELRAFAEKVNQLATVGPAPHLTEQKVPYAMDLDDGVMVNSAALWELVLPLWKDPKSWWASLSAPAGKKDFDWSHLAMRYWPKRVMEKVKKDPSLAVAHSDYGEYKGRDLFKELHPAAAKKWDEQQEKKENKAGEFDFG